MTWPASPLVSRRSAQMFALVIALAGDASANGRFPATNQFVVQPGNTQHLALRTTFGILRSDDGGAHWDWTCESAVGYSGSVDPALSWHRNGTLVAGLFDGISQSDEGTCAWTRDAALGKQVVVDVSTANADATVLDALTGSYDVNSVVGQPEYISAIWSSSPGGRGWSQTSSELPRDVIVESFDRSAIDPERIYVTGESEAGGARAGVLLVSQNGGQTWTRKPFSLDSMGERGVFLAAIDPLRAGRIYLRTSGSDAGRILISDDAGDSFRVIWSGSPPQGFALSADGQTLWVGAFREGLQRASTTDMAFTTINRVPIGCLHYAGNTLFACSLDAYGFAAGRSTDEGQTFDAILHLNQIQGPRDCPGDGGVPVCASEWPFLKNTVGIEDAVDAGPQPVFDGGQGGAVQKEASCKCAVAGAKKKNAPTAWLVTIAIVAFLRPRAARRR